MRDGEKAPVVLVAANQDFLNDLRDALVDTNLALLHAQTKTEAITLLERLTSEIHLAIVNSNCQSLALGILLGNSLLKSP